MYFSPDDLLLGYKERCSELTDGPLQNMETFISFLQSAVLATIQTEVSSTILLHTVNQNLGKMRIFQAALSSNYYFSPYITRRLIKQFHVTALKRHF